MSRPRDFVFTEDFYSRAKPFYLQVRFGAMTIREVVWIAKTLKRDFELIDTKSFDQLLRDAINRGIQRSKIQQDLHVPSDNLFWRVTPRTQGSYRSGQLLLEHFQRLNPKDHLGIDYETSDGAVLFYKGRVHRIEEGLVTLWMGPTAIYRTFKISKIRRTYDPVKIPQTPVLVVKFGPTPCDDSTTEGMMRLTVKVTLREEGWTLKRFTPQPRTGKLIELSEYNYWNKELLRYPEKSRSKNVAQEWSNYSKRQCNCKRCDHAWS